MFFFGFLNLNSNVSGFGAYSSYITLDLSRFPLFFNDISLITRKERKMEKNGRKFKKKIIKEGLR